LLADSASIGTTRRGSAAAAETKDGAVSDIVLVGPFWTRAETAEYLGISQKELCARTDIVRLDGHWLEETYPALQFRDHQVRFEVSALVDFVHDDLTGTAIADWLTRSNPALGAMTPMEWFNTGQDLNTALNVARADIETEANRIRPSSGMAVAS
jgi:hypothetical protein